MPSDWSGGATSTLHTQSVVPVVFSGGNRLQSSSPNLSETSFLYELSDDEDDAKAEDVDEDNVGAGVRNKGRYTRGCTTVRQSEQVEGGYTRGYTVQGQAWKQRAENAPENVLFTPGTVYRPTRAGGGGSEISGVHYEQIVRGGGGGHHAPPSCSTSTLPMSPAYHVSGIVGGSPVDCDGGRGRCGDGCERGEVHYEQTVRGGCGNSTRGSSGGGDAEDNGSGGISLDRGAGNCLSLDSGCQLSASQPMSGEERGHEAEDAGYEGLGLGFRSTYMKPSPPATQQAQKTTVKGIKDSLDAFDRIAAKRTCSIYTHGAGTFAPDASFGESRWAVDASSAGLDQSMAAERAGVELRTGAGAKAGIVLGGVNTASHWTPDASSAHLDQSMGPEPRTVPLMSQVQRVTCSRVNRKLEPLSLNP